MLIQDLDLVARTTVTPTSTGLEDIQDAAHGTVKLELDGTVGWTLVIHRACHHASQTSHSAQLANIDLQSGLVKLIL